MYQGRYPDSIIPPGYNGTVYNKPEPQPEPCPPPPKPDVKAILPPIFGDITEHLFSHKIDLEDLLLIGLTVLFINSGADTNLIIAMALLFVMGL